MKYEPQKITMKLLRDLSNKLPPEDADGKRKPREIWDRSRGIVLRHQPSGYMAIYAQLGRGKRERLCNVRDILDDYNALTLNAVFERAKVLHGESASGRDFSGERKAQRAVPTLTEYLNDTYSPWALVERRSGEATVARLRSCFEKSFGRRRLTELTPARLATWSAKRRNAGIRPETINRDIAALRAALGKAVKLEIIAKNPLAGIEELEVDRHKQVVRALTAPEKAQLIEALEDRDATKRQGRASANEWREKRGLTQADLAKRVGVRQATISRLETGDSRRIELDALDRLLQVLRCKPNDLLQRKR